MQRTLPDFQEAGYEIFGISYDPVEALAEFARSRGITFPLLSDAGSQIIEHLGLLNTHIEQQQAFYGFAVSERHRGLPYPGTFVLDERGVVVSKHFEQSYRDRPSGSYLLHEVGAPPSATSYEARALDRGVVVRAWVEEPTYRPMQRTVLQAGMELAAGLHVYTDPVPEGYVSTSFEILPQEGLQTWPAEIPTGDPFEVDGLDERFSVLGGSFEVAIPYKVSGSRHLLDGRARPEPKRDDLVVLTLVVSYQACTESRCFPPAQRRLSVPLLEEGLER